MEVKLVVLAFEFDSFDISKFELVGIVLLTPLERICNLLHVDVLQIVGEEEQLESVYLMLGCHLKYFPGENVTIERVELIMVNIFALDLSPPRTGSPLLRTLSDINLEDDLALSCSATLVTPIFTVNIFKYHLLVVGA